MQSTVHFAAEVYGQLPSATGAASVAVPGDAPTTLTAANDKRLRSVLSLSFIVSEAGAGGREGR